MVPTADIENPGLKPASATQKALLQLSPPNQQ
jgi:hypothetical protein